MKASVRYRTEAIHDGDVGFGSDMVKGKRVIRHRKLSFIHSLIVDGETDQGEIFPKQRQVANIGVTVWIGADMECATHTRAFHV